MSIAISAAQLPRMLRFTLADDGDVFAARFCAIDVAIEPNLSADKTVGSAWFGVEQVELRGHAAPPSASFARVRLTMSDSEPSIRRTRYMPGHFGSGTMRGSKTGFLGEARPVFSGLETIVLSREISAWPTVDSTWAHPRSFFAFCPTFEAFRRRRLRLASCAAYRHTS